MEGKYVLFPPICFHENRERAEHRRGDLGVVQVAKERKGMMGGGCRGEKGGYGLQRREWRVWVAEEIRDGGCWGEVEDEWGFLFFLILISSGPLNDMWHPVIVHIAPRHQLTGNLTTRLMDV
ncbi:heat shock 22 kDa protein [Pyrus ussuriensis x Pyrus communis]|uniref:Heat shock 22 kDa protein n=1 Tax=Pyrus ussuriensis x Pyrus communis TaxID=2448454 RepID=A0A5N5HSG4_9ROSA|nr:heat shock 22 kDa protein [Pyrus ussuriensis x Pyrus communis]